MSNTTTTPPPAPPPPWEAPREVGMIFNTTMVRAILDGRKTATRRLDGLANWPAVWEQPSIRRIEKGNCKGPWGFYALFQRDDGDGDLAYARAPVKPGDTIWVRETFKPVMYDENGRVLCHYKTGDWTMMDGPDDNGDSWATWTDERLAHGFIADDNGVICNPDGSMATPGELASAVHWTPSIHMPRWACRLTLAVTAVRVERLHDITDDGARAEGVADRAAFEALWRDLYGSDAWDESLWVWVIDFMPCKQVPK